MSKSNAWMIGVWGARGSGKSSYVKCALKGAKRVVVLDPMDEYSDEGFTRVESVNQARDVMARNLAGFRIALVPQSTKQHAYLHQLSILLYQLQSGFKDGTDPRKVTMVVEEMNQSFSLAKGIYAAPQFAELCSRGRHYGINVYGLSQRIAEVATRFRGNCSETVVLRQKGPRDIQAAIDETGADRAQVKALRNLEYIHERNGELSAGTIKIRKTKKDYAM